MGRKDTEARKAYRRETYAANREREIAKTTAWRLANPEKARSGQRRTRYGLAPEDMSALLALQGNACAICDTLFPLSLLTRPKRDPIRVDHDHDSNAVRGLLCNKCNVLEGRIKKYGDRLQAYLANPPARVLELA